MKRQKFDIMNFHDGNSATDVVGRKSLFKDKADFVEMCKEEFDFIFDNKDEDEQPIVDKVQEGYVRYYPKAPERVSADFIGGCYTFCEKSVGAFEVYFINLR